MLQEFTILIERANNLTGNSSERLRDIPKVMHWDISKRESNLWKKTGVCFHNNFVPQQMEVFNHKGRFYFEYDSGVFL